MKYLLTIFIFIINIAFSHSQVTPEDKFGAWYIIDGSHRVSNKFSLKTGFQLRSFEVLDNINLLLFHTGVNYHLNKKTTLTVAYFYLDIDRTFLITGEDHTYENRPYEQISYKQETKTLPIYHRLRLEHRFLSFRHNRTTLHRFRYRLGTKINLNETFFLNINNELFANLQDQVFTENRFYAALGIHISQSTNLQLGYLNHEINKQNLNRLQVGVFFKTDFRKKLKK